MIETREELKLYLKEDGKRNGFANYWQYCLRLFCKSENALAYRYLRALRHCEYHSGKKSVLHKMFYFLYWFKRSRLGSKYHIQIPLNKVGYGLRIMHLSGGGGILINIDKMGNYCGVNSGVLIGDNGATAVPTIGHHVAFGPGAKAFGKITIGDKVFVAPNAVVTKDIPGNCIVGGIPAKILKYKE